MKEQIKLNTMVLIYLKKKYGKTLVYEKIQQNY